jgi:osmotically-inducible protein OsmY
MIKPNFTLTGTVALILMGLTGCATYEKCGIEGCAGDAKITAKVQAAFGHHPDLGEPNSINVQTLNHVVYLSGDVSDVNMSETAEAIAKTIKGVTRVENNIGVSQ